MLATFFIHFKLWFFKCSNAGKDDILDYLDFSQYLKGISCGDTMDISF